MRSCRQRACLSLDFYAFCFEPGARCVWGPNSCWRNARLVQREFELMGIFLLLIFVFVALGLVGIYVEMTTDIDIATSVIEVVSAIKNAVLEFITWCTLVDN